MKKIYLVLLFVLAFNMEGFAMTEIADYKCFHKGCGGAIRVEKDFDICIKCGEKFHDFIGVKAGENISSGYSNVGFGMKAVHKHDWQYYGVETEMRIPPLDDFTETGHSVTRVYKYRGVAHYRACECGKTERNNKGKWEKF